MKPLDPGNEFGPIDVPLVESIIEGSFKETTRNGKHTLRSVILALTPGVLIITESRLEGKLNSQENGEGYGKIPSVHLVDSSGVTVFKKSQRQTLKIVFDDKCYRYFELEKSSRREMVWNMWCKQVSQQRNKKIRLQKIITDNTISLDWNIINNKSKPHRSVWNDKYLYLGYKRELEDQSRPSPVPGRTEHIKLLYLKSQYFGCWDQSEHWVQCESSKHFNLDADS